MFTIRSLLVAASLAPALALAQGVTLSHAGYLLDADDAPVEGTLGLHFRLLDAETGGTEAWSSGPTACPVTLRAGYFAVALGRECGGAIPSSALPPNALRWLETTIGSVSLAPRLAITAVPAASRALLADDASRFGGQLPAYYRDAGNLTGTAPASVLPLATASERGALSAADKQKIDAIGAGAQLVSLTGTAPIGVTAGANPVVSIANATTSTPGAMSAADKLKLDGIVAGAGLTGLAVTAPITSTGGASPTLAINVATSANAGVMSAADKQKLDALVLNQATASAVPRRQTVLTGNVNAWGAASFLSAGSGLAVSLAATATPVVVAFADGFDAGGARDFLGTVSADVANAWTGLPANTTSYLYVDRNASTGALTFGHTPRPPTYGVSIGDGASVVPAMTSATAPSGVVTASSNYDTTWTAFRAFDKLTDRTAGAA